MKKLSDEEIVKSLTMHRGIGIWTAQMLLIFNLGASRRVACHRPRHPAGLQDRLWSG